MRDFLKVKKEKVVIKAVDQAQGQAGDKNTAKNRVYSQSNHI
jgi:hypothetical protein